jgi:hypothetical protein
VTGWHASCFALPQAETRDRARGGTTAIPRFGRIASLSSFLVTPIMAENLAVAIENSGYKKLGG